MKLIFRVALATMLFSNMLYADWNSVAKLPANSKIEVSTEKGKRTRAEFVSSAGENLVLREKSGERTLKRSDIREVKVLEPSHQSLAKGLLWTGVGAAGGAAVGGLSCPQCPNEGAGYGNVTAGAAIGAMAGAVFGFLRHSAKYQTIYKDR